MLSDSFKRKVWTFDLCLIVIWEHCQKHVYKLKCNSVFFTVSTIHTCDSIVCVQLFCYGSWTMNYENRFTFLGYSNKYSLNNSCLSSEYDKHCCRCCLSMLSVICCSSLLTLLQSFERLFRWIHRPWNMVLNNVVWTISVVSVMSFTLCHHPVHD